MGGRQTSEFGWERVGLLFYVNKAHITRSIDLILIYVTYIEFILYIEPCRKWFHFAIETIFMHVSNITRSQKYEHFISKYLQRYTS